MIELIRLRRYGAQPYNLILIHGGPGDSGSLKPLADELEKDFGILEPIQTKSTLRSLLKEIKDYIDIEGSKPVVLIGHSFGAWLSYLYAATYPNDVKKIVLVGSGPFQQEYYEHIQKNRLRRLDENQRAKFQKLIDELSNPTGMDMDAVLQELEKYLHITDNFDVDPELDDLEDTRKDLVLMDKDSIPKVLNEAIKKRKTGELLEMGKKISCPVIVMHGDYDPHPFDGLKTPLSKVLENVKFIKLEKCGHFPWKEKKAKDTFYKHLRENI